MKQSRSSVKIGNVLSPQFEDASTPKCRTDAQWNAVMDWHSNHPSAWWCINPFFPHPTPGARYKCSFVHTYFSTDGSIHVIKVTPAGRVTEVPPTPEYTGYFKAETDAVTEMYGAFHG